MAALADAEEDLATAPRSVAPAAVPMSAADRRRPSRPWLGGAVAAMLIGGLGVGTWRQRAQPYTVETAAGQTRAVDLADGSRIVLAGGTRLRLDRREPRMASVESGQALFRVRHDAVHAFRVDAGGVKVTDLGTTFDAGLHGSETSVAVAEGAVMVDSGGAAVRLDQGQAARIGRGRIKRAAVEPADVGGWQEGRWPSTAFR